MNFTETAVVLGPGTIEIRQQKTLCSTTRGRPVGCAETVVPDIANTVTSLSVTDTSKPEPSHQAGTSSERQIASLVSLHEGGDSEDRWSDSGGDSIRGMPPSQVFAVRSINDASPASLETWITSLRNQRLRDRVWALAALVWMAVTASRPLHS